MPPKSPPAPSAAEARLVQVLGFIATGVVRGRAAPQSKFVHMRSWYTVVSVVFSLLGGAGLVTTKVEKLPADVTSAAFVVALVSLVVLMAMELYRAFNVDEQALRRLAAAEAFSLLEAQTRHALQDIDPQDAVEQARKQLQSLERMFHNILPDPPEGEPAALVAKWVAGHRPADGWQLSLSQQKPKEG